MKITSEQDMLNAGKSFAKKITNTPFVIELIGDVGAGKTTFTRGLAEGLGTTASVTSPSYTITKSYPLPNNHILAHYDFYRLSDPGLMVEDLNESINNPNTVTVIEWGESIANILPENHIKISIQYNEDGSRSIIYL